MALAVAVLLAVALSSATQWLTWSFAPGAAVVVCLGVAAFAAAGMLLWWEADQVGNAVLIWVTGLLFAADKALAWPGSPLIMLGQWFGWLYFVTLAVVLLRYPSGRLDPRLRTVMWLIAAALLVLRTVVVLSRRGVDQVWPTHPPWTDPAARVWWPTLFADGSIPVLAERFWLVGSVAAAVAVLIAMRRRMASAHPLARHELAIMWLALLFLAAVVVVRVGILAWVQPSLPEEEVSAVLQGATVLVIPLALSLSSCLCK